MSIPDKKSKILIAPSILSADFSNLSRDIGLVEKNGADLLHIDVMDGHFVPNITIGPVVVKDLRKISKLFFDVHLMIQRPDLYWQEFKNADAGSITFHSEVKLNKLNLIKKIKKAGLKVGVSIKPKTPVSHIVKLLPYLDLVLIMTVEPGFGGQSFISATLPKIKKIKSIVENNFYSCDIEVDGGINNKTAVEAVKAGANILVAGNTIFKAENPVKALKDLKKAVN
ncbi:ribulose-phosphate 3-epimerase [Elusimicrobiota bacterium]